MTYAFTYEVPITAEIYARIKEGIGPQRPPGLIAHLAYRTEAGLRYIEVWQTKDDWEAFEHDRVHPAVTTPPRRDTRLPISSSRLAIGLPGDRRGGPTRD